MIMQWVLIYTVIVFAPAGALGFDTPAAITRGEVTFTDKMHCEEGLIMMKDKLQNGNKLIEGVCLYRGFE